MVIISYVPGALGAETTQKGFSKAHRFDVKTDGRDGGDYFAQLELVQNGGLARSVKAHHEDAHVLLGHELGPYCAKDVSLRRQSAGNGKQKDRVNVTAQRPAVGRK